MDSGTAWVLWILMFWVIEGDALWRKQTSDTLTEHLRKWFSMKEKARAWRLRRFALLAGLAWISAHLLAPAGTF